MGVEARQGACHFQCGDAIWICSVGSVWCGSAAGHGSPSSHDFGILGPIHHRSRFPQVLRFPKVRTIRFQVRPHSGPRFLQQLMRILPFIPTENEIDQLIGACGKNRMLPTSSQGDGQTWRSMEPEMDRCQSLVALR